MSSSESEDENLKQFAAAVDTSLFNNDFYRDKHENKKKVEEIKSELKSQRYLDNTENIFQSELNVSESMKKHIGSKMSKIIEDSVEFVNVVTQKNHIEEVDSLRLLKGFKECVNLNKKDYENYPKQKIPIKRRLLEDHALKSSVKIQLAAIDIEKIKREVSHWDRRERHKVIGYKKFKGIYHQIE